MINFTQLPINRKLLVGFTLMIALSIFTGATAFINNILEDRIAEQSQEAARLTHIAHEINIEVLEARRLEKEYLLYYKEEGFEAADEKYVVVLQAHNQNIYNRTAALREFNDSKLATISEDIDTAAAKYETDFLQTVKNLKSRGYLDTGLEGDFRATVRAIEDELSSAGDEHLTNLMLTVRRREKNYLLRLEYRYIEQAHTAVANLKNAVSASDALSPNQKTTINNLADDYLVDFDALAAKDVEIRAGIADFRAAADRIDPKVEDINAIAKTQQETTEANESRIASISQSILVIALLTSIMVGTLLAYFTSRSITTPLSSLNNATQSIAAGNLDVEFNIHSHDEVGQLAGSFAIMAAELRTMINRERDARQILENTVIQYVSFVENVAKGHLTDRLMLEDTTGDDPLFQLGLNLNHMAEGIQDLTIRMEESAQADRAARSALQSTLEEYMQFVGAVADGDLTRRLHLGTNENRQGDEDLIRLGADLNRMVGSLALMAGQTKQIGSSIAAAVSEILAATTQQLATATEQDATVSQTATTASEVQATVTQTAQRAENVALTAQRSVEASQRGQQAVSDSVDGMRRIRYQVEGIAENILVLSERTQQISQIINSVNNIAEQSKVLALNASIEAARAGEEGKSFAVVAMEVRNLAEQSREATEQIREILSEIQQATNASVLATEEGIKGVDQGEQLISQAGQAITELAGVIQEAAQAAAQIAAATHQQTVGMEQLTTAMDSIRQASMQTTTTVQQAERSAQGLNEMAEQMQETVEQYRL